MFEGMIGENEAVEVNFEVQLTGNKVKRMKNFHTTMIQPADSQRWLSAEISTKPSGSFHIGCDW